MSFLTFIWVNTEPLHIILVLVIVGLMFTINSMLDNIALLKQNNYLMTSRYLSIKTQFEHAMKLLESGTEQSEKLSNQNMDLMVMIKFLEEKLGGDLEFIYGTTEEQSEESSKCD